MPERDGDRMYRIKSPLEEHERVVGESLSALPSRFPQVAPRPGDDPATLRRCCSWQHWAASPLKRLWRENWFQPVVRIGALGNYEHVLQQPPPCLSFI